ncbi:MAG: PAS domain S-box protein [Spongiibacteraceae bacterium]
MTLHTERPSAAGPTGSQQSAPQQIVPQQAQWLGLGRSEWAIVAAAIVAIILIGLLALSLLKLQEQSRAASEFVAHTYEVTSCISQSRAQLARAQSSQRGYLLTSDKGYLDTRDQSLTQLSAAMRLCTDITRDNPRQQSRLQELKIRLDERQRGFDTQLQLFQNGSHAQLATVLSEARISSDSIVTLFNELQAEEERLLQLRQQDDQRLSQRLQTFSISLAFVCALLIASALLYVLRVLHRRLQLVADLEQSRQHAHAAIWQRQQDVLDSVPSAMLMADDAGHLVFVNSQLTALFGYSAEELVGQPMEILVPERYRSAHVGHRNRYFDNPTARVMGAGRELFGLRRDGLEVPVEIGLHPLVTDDGHFVLASIIDISERRREEERLRLVIEAAPNAMLMINQKGLITLVNSQTEKMFGYAREELLGQSVDMLVPLHVRQQHAGFRERFNAQPSVRSMGAGRELYGLHRDGNRVPIEIGLNPIETAEGSFVLTSIIDISERKRALEEELRRTSEALASRFEETRAAALTLFNSEFDEQRILIGTLDLLAERHQFPVALFYGADPLGGLLHLVATRGAPASAQAQIRFGDGLVGSAAQSGRMMYIDRVAPEQVSASGGVTIQTGFSEIVPAALLFCPVSYRGQLLGVLALGASDRLPEGDRSAVERLTAQLGAALHNIRQYANLQTLAQQLRERGEEIQLKNNQLEAASRMKSEFLANMSHELRTPLNAIIGFAEVLKDGLAGELNPQQRECIADIFDSGQHLLALINDILDLSKIEAGRLELDLETVDAIAIVESGMTVVREKAMTHRVRLLPQWAAGLGRVTIDARKSKQIIFNLLSNAVKFTPEGGEVRVAVDRVTRDAVEAALAIKPGRMFANLDMAHREYLQIRITDSGIGIAADDLQRLFEPFTQLDSALSRKHAGTGLGLAMVRRLTELLAGALAVDSAVAIGSTFTVWLPWLPAQPLIAAQAPEIPMRQSLEPPLILVVEDRVQDAQLLRLQLSEAGFRVQIAESGELALKAIADNRPDAIVLDVILPGMDGWDLLSRLKSETALAEIPVVIVSVTDEAQHGFVLGAADVLVKPVAQADLMNALRGVGMLPAQPRKVLVIDDDARTVSLLRGQLQAAGFIVVGSYGGRDGIALAQSEQPDLVVLDLLMPDVSGFDVVTALRDDPATADIPVLILTAHDLSTDERAELRGVVLQILEKSEFQTADFIAQIHRALRRN